VGEGLLDNGAPRAAEKQGHSVVGWFVNAFENTWGAWDANDDGGQCQNIITRFQKKTTYA
jgi:hypothetical protein